MKLLQKIFKKKNNRKLSDDSFIRSDVVYNTEKNLIILVAFTEDYTMSVLEFVSACTLCDIKTKLLQTSYDEVLDELDEDGNEIIISHLKNYLLIGGKPNNYYSIFDKISSLSNYLLVEISNDLYNYTECCDKLINNNILNRSLYNSDIKYDEYKTLSSNIFYDDAKTVLDKLPDGFNTLDIIDFVYVYIIDNNSRISFYMLPKTISSKDKLERFTKILNGIVEHPSVDIFLKLSKPLYMQEDLSDEIISGSLSDQNLDELFLQKYETFRGIADEEVEYEELVDEILEDDEEM